MQDIDYELFFNMEIDSLLIIEKFILINKQFRKFRIITYLNETIYWIIDSRMLSKHLEIYYNKNVYINKYIIYTLINNDNINKYLLFREKVD